MLALSILVVSPQPLLLEAICARFQRAASEGIADFRIAAACRTLQQAAEPLESMAVDAVLLDVDAIDSSPEDAMATIRGTHGAPRVIALSSHADVDTALPFLRAGAAGFLSKSSEPEDLIAVARQIMEDDLVISPELQYELAALAVGRRRKSVAVQASAPHDLNPHETEVLACLARGLNNSEIAETLYVSIGSVKAYLSSASRKLGARDRVQLLLRAMNLGLVGEECHRPARSD